jgi:outer membrane lipoprotein LolB
MQLVVNFPPVSRLAPAGRKHLLRLALLLSVVFALVACSSISDLPVTDESYRVWSERQVQLSNIDSWEIHARAAIFVEQEVYQVGISWHRESNNYVILIEAPFGQGVFRVETNLTAEAAPPMKLSLPDGQVFYDDSAEALLVKVIGWSFPVSGLKSWIIGLPLIETDYTFDLRSDGRLKSLRQDDWLINYLDYFANGTAERGLPRKMYLKHNNLALKIVIDRWQQLQAKVSSPVIFPDFD